MSVSFAEMEVDERLTQSTVFKDQASVATSVNQLIPRRLGAPHNVPLEQSYSLAGQRVRMGGISSLGASGRAVPHYVRSGFYIP